MKRILCLVVVSIAALGAAAAQSSASYRLTESTFNAGGQPRDGAFPSSTSYQIRLDAAGDVLTGVGLSSSGFRLADGFVDAYAPPGEVMNVRWTDVTKLVWNPEPSVGSYNLYRGSLSSLPGSFGTCFQSSIGSETWTDATTPALGTGWFYLVTARNRLSEEGTKGFRSNNIERGNPSPCP